MLHMDSTIKYPEHKGLKIGTAAPNVEAEDIDGTKINLKELLKENQGIIIDFFRGTW